MNKEKEKELSLKTRIRREMVVKKPTAKQKIKGEVFNENRHLFNSTNGWEKSFEKAWRKINKEKR